MILKKFNCVASFDFIIGPNVSNSDCVTSHFIEVLTLSTTLSCITLRRNYMVWPLCLIGLKAWHCYWGLRHQVCQHFLQLGCAWDIAEGNDCIVVTSQPHLGSGFSFEGTEYGLCEFLFELSILIHTQHFYGTWPASLPKICNTLQ